MSDNSMQKYLSVCVVGLFILSAFGAMGNVLMEKSPMNGLNDGDVIQEQPDMEKLDESLRDAANSNIKGLTKVIIATTNVGELADFLKDYEYRGLIGNKGISDGRMSTVVLDVPANCLDAIAGIPSVYGVYAYPEVGGDYTAYDEIGAGTGTEGDVPQSIYDSEQHNAQEAWAAGYIGTGSNVAIPEGGIDFGHPDLQGTQARVPETLKVIGHTIVTSAIANQTTTSISHTDLVPGTLAVYVNGTPVTGYTYYPDNGTIVFDGALNVGESVAVDYQLISPYAGWPIVFDYNSMSTYLDTGKTTDTWYVSTNETAEKYSTPNNPELDVEITVEREVTFYSDVATSKPSTKMKHGAIKKDSVTVYKDSVEMTSGYTVDHDMGKITFSPSISVKKIEVSYIYFAWDNVPASQRIVLKESTGYIPEIAGSPESYTITGMEANTNYLFNIVATDEADNHGVFSNNPDAVTNEDVDPPAMITDLVAEEGGSHGTVDISWTATGDDGSTGTAAGYLLKYSETPITNWVCFDYLSEEYAQSWAPKASGDAEAYTLTGLGIGKEYHFALVALDEGGNSGPVSNSNSAVVKNDTVAPARIDPVASPGYNSTEIILEWTATGDDGSIGTAAGYELRYSTSNITTPAEFEAATLYTDSLSWSPQPAGSAESYSVIMPSPGITYYFSLVAIDIAGNVGPISSPAGFAVSQSNDVIPPAQVTDLTIETGINHGEVFMNFTAPGDDGMDGWAQKYVVKYYTSIINATNWDTIPEDYGVSGTYEQLPSIPLPKPLQGNEGQSIVLGNNDGIYSYLPAGVDYYFAIRAFDGVNYGPVSNCDHAIVQEDTVGPSTATLNIGESEMHGSVLLDWISPGDDGMVGTPKVYVIRYHTSPVTDANWGSLTGSSYSIERPNFMNEFGFIPTGGDHIYLNFSAGDKLVQGVDYYFGLRVTDEWDANTPPVSNSPSGMVRNDDVAPGTIALSAAATDQQGAVELTWAAPGDDGNDGTVMKYEIRYVKAHYQNDFVDADVQFVGVLNPTKVWTTYTVTGIHSESGIYRLGDLPDENLATYVNNYNNFVTNYSKLLLVDSEKAGVYDTIYIDLDYDQDFSDEKPCRLGDEISWRDYDGDGLADVSGGMVYYISQASVVTDETLTFDADTGKNAVIGHDGILNNSWSVYINGTLADENGNYTIDFEKGTISFSANQSANTVTISYEYDGLSIPYSETFADKRGVDNVIPRNGELVAMYGEYALDMTLGTSRASGIVGKAKMPHLIDTDLKPILGIAPDAKIIGITDPMYDGMMFAIEGYDGIPGTGDEADIYSSSLAMGTYEAGGDFTSQYVDWLATEYGQGKTIFTASSGENGPGYGTISSPGSAPGVITAGLATDFYYRIAEGQDTGRYPAYGDVIPVSGRGPTIMGNPKPDIVMTGAYFNFIAEGLWTAYDRGPNAGYTQVVNTGQGGGLASSNLAAAIALISDAYDDSHAQPLDIETARKLLMSGAEDIHYDVLSQGAGFVDVMESIRIATETGGSMVSPTSWVPGDYNGEIYEAFTKIVGEDTLPSSLEQTFTIENTGDSSMDMDVDLFAGEMLKAGESMITITRDAEYGHGWTILNETGFYDPQGELLQALDTSLWTDTNLLKITQYSTDPNGDYWLELYDWDDENEDGKIDGPLDSGPYETPPVPFAERNRMTAAFIYGNVLEVRTHDQNDPDRVHDGIAIWTRALVNPLEPLDLHIKAEFYKREAWDWVTLSDSSLTISPGGTGTFTATLDAAKAMAEGVGSYEGAITTMSDAGKTTVIPVVVNVAASNPNFEFGGAPAKDEIDSFVGVDTTTITNLNYTIANDTYYSKSNETFNDTEFYLGYSEYFQGFGGVINHTYLALNNTTFTYSPYERQSAILGDGKANDTLIENEAVGGFATVMLSHDNIVPGTERFLIYTYGDWYWLGPDEANNTGWYTFTPETGEFVLDWNFEIGDYFYAWYDYNVTGFIPITNTSWYSVDNSTGLVTLNTTVPEFAYGLQEGSSAHTWYEFEVEYINVTKKTDFQLSHTNIILESVSVTEDGAPLSDFNTVSREIIMNNTREYEDELVIKAANNATTTAYLELYEAGYEVGPDTYTLYLDGEEMIERYGNTNIDYILDLQTGEITFGAPLDWGMEVRADYGTYAVGVTELYVANGDIYDQAKSGANVLGYQVYRNGKKLIGGQEYLLSIIPVKNETSITAAGGETDFDLANRGIILTSENTLYLEDSGWTPMVNSETAGKPNYSINNNTGHITLNGWTLAAGDKVHSYYNYSGCVEGKIKLKIFNQVKGEVAVESATAGQTTFSVFYDNLNDVGKSSPNTFYFTNGSGTFKMIKSGTDGPLKYTINTATGDITLNNWAMETGDSVIAYYNYTGLKSGDFFEIDYSYGRYNFNPINGKLDFLSAPGGGSDLDVSYSYYGTDRLFDPSIMFSGFDGAGGRPGDWRYYYVDIPDQGIYKNPKTKLLINTEWWKEQTDIDAFAFGNADHINTETGASFPVERYGPYGMKNNGGSTETADVFTASGGPLEEAAPSVGAGLNVIALHTVRMNGTANIEPINGDVGTFILDKDKVSIVTNKLSGSETITAYSSMELGGHLGGVAAGPSAPTQYKDMLVYQDEADWSLFPTFEAQLASGNTSIPVTLKDCLIFDVHVYGHTDAYAREGSYKDVVDLDLGIFLDENGDGITQEEEFYAMCADGDADEQVKLIAPPDGDYIIRVFGFTLKTVPAHYDIDITNVQGLGFGVEGEGEDLTPDNPDQWKTDSPIDPFTLSSLTLTYDLPSAKDGITLQGALYLGPGNAPFTMLMAIELRYDVTGPTDNGNTPTDGGITRNRYPTITASFVDNSFGELVSDGASLKLDGIDITTQTNINIPLVDDEESPVQGYPTGTLSYMPSSPLSDGIHTVEATMSDLAGNIVTRVWSFVVDTAAPSLTIDTDSVVYTNSDVITITGTADPSSTLKVIGPNVISQMHRSDGIYFIDIGLDEGENIIQVTATDSINNKAMVGCKVFYDVTMPSFGSVRFSDGFITNKPVATMTGTLSETGTLAVNGGNVMVNSDGTFSHSINLREGVNTVHLQFTDLSGNTVDSWQNLTLDTVAPQIALSNDAQTVHDSSIEISGTVEAGADLFINGKRVQADTRQSGEFSSTVTLSPGLNTIVIEAEDAAGNVAEQRYTVTYDSIGEASTNWGAISLMIVLLVVGLVLGLYFGGLLGFGLTKEEEEDISSDEMDIYEEDIEDDTTMDEEIAEEDMEDITEEELPDDELVPEDEEIEEIPEEDLDGEEFPEDVDAEPIPQEEALPEDFPEEEEPVDISDDITEEAPEEVDDPRIAKLKEAFESGKISEELYEKNLAKFKGE